MAIIDWVIAELPVSSGLTIARQCAVLRNLHLPSNQLADKLRATFLECPCDILFVHRDAERAGLAHRLEEITAAMVSAGGDVFVPIVPVKMTEAWLLFDQEAIRRASDNPNGTIALGMPRSGRLHELNDPKKVLAELLVY